MKIGFYININKAKKNNYSEILNIFNDLKSINNIDYEIITLNKINFNSYYQIKSVIFSFLNQRHVKRLFINKLNFGFLLFTYYFTFFMHLKILFRNFFKKNNYDYVFISSDCHFNEELIISQYVKTLCFQTTINFTSVSELIKYLRFHETKSKYSFRKKSYYTRFHQYYGYHSGCFYKHLVLKSLNLLPKGERLGLGNSSYIFVWGNKFKELYKEIGVECKKIINIGSFSHYSLNIKKNSKSTEKSLITVFLQPIKSTPDYLYGAHTYYDALEIIINQCLLFNEKKHKLIFKEHPKTIKSDFLREFYNLFPTHKIVDHYSRQSNLYLIQNSFINIMMNSSVGIDCMLHKSSVLSFGYDINYARYLKYICSDIYVDNPSDSLSYLEKIFTDRDFKTKLESKCHVKVLDYVNINNNLVSDFNKFIYKR